MYVLVLRMKEGLRGIAQRPEISRSQISRARAQKEVAKSVYQMA